MAGSSINSLHFIGSVANEASGPTYSVTSLCSGLRKAGGIATLIALNGDRSDKTLSGEAQVFDRGWGPRRLGRSPSLNKWATEKLSDPMSFGAVHIHTLWFDAGVRLIKTAHASDLPIVVSPRGCFTDYAMHRGSRFKSIYWTSYQKPALLQASCFHATAELELEDIRRLGFEQPVAVIPNGVHLPERVATHAAKQTRRLLFLSRLHPNKGLDILLQAWQVLMNYFTDWELAIAGPDEGSYAVYIKRLANDLGLRNITFLGPKFGDEKLDLYASSDLFVLPTYSENFGMVVAEALSAALPVVTTTAAPWQEIVDNRSGWLAEPNFHSLLDQLRNAMSASGETRKESGLLGRKWMAEAFDWAHLASQMSAVYEWLDRPDIRSVPSCVQVES